MEELHFPEAQEPELQNKQTTTALSGNWNLGTCGVCVGRETRSNSESKHS